MAGKTAININGGISTAGDDQTQAMPRERTHQTKKDGPGYLVDEEEVERPHRPDDANLDIENPKPSDEETLVRGGVIIRDGRQCYLD